MKIPASAIMASFLSLGYGIAMLAPERVRPGALLF
jgi:hypothetical protein